MSVKAPTPKRRIFGCLCWLWPAHETMLLLPGYPILAAPTQLTAIRLKLVDTPVEVDSVPASTAIVSGKLWVE